VTDDDASETYEELLRLLAEHGLDWLATDIRNTIASGKIASVSIVYGGRGVIDEHVASARQRKDIFQRNEPYEPKDRLKILISAIEHALVAPSEMVPYILRMVISRNNTPYIEFRSDDRSSPIFTLSHQEAEQNRIASVELRRALEKLSTEIG
jgi:hypothetical protein